MRPVEAGQLFVRLRADGRRVKENRAQQRQRQAQAAQDDVLPRCFQRSPPVVKRHQQDGRQGGGFHGEPHHAHVVGQHHEKHARLEQRRQHEKLPHAPKGDGPGLQVALEIPSGVERRAQRHDGDQQHHPRAQGVRAQELVPFGHHALLQHPPHQGHAQGQGGQAGQPPQRRHHAARPRRQARQSRRRRHEDKKREQWHVILSIG